MGEKRNVYSLLMEKLKKNKHLKNLGEKCRVMLKRSPRNGMGGRGMD
jgi:hypothetical protein